MESNRITSRAILLALSIAGSFVALTPVRADEIDAIWDQCSDPDPSTRFEACNAIITSGKGGTDLALAYNNRGGAQVQLHHYQQAIADFDQALRLDASGDAGTGQPGAVYAQRGSAYQKLGQLQKALNDFNQAIAHGFTSVTARRNALQTQLANSGQQQEATREPAGEPTQEATNETEPSACSGTPDQELAAFNEDLANMRAAHPMPPQSAGARATYQYSYTYAIKGLELLEPRKACMGVHYQANYTALVKVRDSSKSGCDKLSASNGECPVQFPK